jgi:hypothetical protein
LFGRVFISEGKYKPLSEAIPFRTALSKSTGLDK